MQRAQDRPPQQRRAQIGDLAAQAVAAAQRQPEQAQAILGFTAEEYYRRAGDPRNAPAAAELRGLADQLYQTAQLLGAGSDFAELQAQTLSAHQLGAPDDLQLVAYRQQVNEAQATPRVSIAPESFSRNTALGRYATFKWAPTAEEHALGVRQEDTLAIWPGLKHEAQAFTVDTALANPPVAPPDTSLHSFDARPYGFVEYGSDGSKTRVLFDIGFGARFTVAGNYIAVGAGMSPNPDGVLSVALRIGASLGTFAAPSQAPVTKTEFVDRLVDGNTSDLILRPMKATQLLPLLTNSIAGTTRLDFFNWKGGPTPINSIVWQNGVTISTPPIPLPPDMVYLKVSNNTGDHGEANYRLVFQLSL